MSGNGTVAGFLTSLSGTYVPGGCDQCHSFPFLSAMEPGIWNVAAHHDEWCSLFNSAGATTRPAEAALSMSRSGGSAPDVPTP